MVATVLLRGLCICSCDCVCVSIHVHIYVLFVRHHVCSVCVLPEASEIMRSIGEAIQALHAINIAHRDVKVGKYLMHVGLA